MKKFIASALAVSLAAVSLSAAVFAEDGVINDEEFIAESELFEIGAEEPGFFKPENAAGAVLHIELKEQLDSSMTLNLKFYFGEKEYDLLYILMMPEQIMDLPLSDIVTALIERYPDETLPFDELTSVELEDIGYIDSVWVEEAPSAGGDTEGKDFLLLMGDLSALDGTGEEALHIELTKPYNDSMVLGMILRTANSTYRVDYILMKAEQTMEIPVKDIRNAFDDRYPDEIIPYGEVISFQIMDAVGMLKEVYLTDTDIEPVEEDTFFITNGSEWELTNAADTIMNANATAGGNVGFVIYYGTALNDGFALEFVFTGSDGIKKSLKASYSEPLPDKAVFVKVRDLLEAADVSPQDIGGFSIVNGGDAPIEWITTGMDIPDSADITFPEADVSAGNDINPGTGAGLAVAAMLASGALCAVFRKRK